MRDPSNYSVQLSPIVVLSLISKFQSEIMNPRDDQIKTRTEDRGERREDSSLEKDICAKEDKVRTL